MNPDFVTLMAASMITRAHAQSALPDAPVIEDFIDRTPRAPRMESLRKQLAELIWPGELTVSSIEPPSPFASC
jgi:hypothetical protein